MSADKNNSESTFPRFLSNQPCCKDLFKGNSHSKIAKSIADLIVSGKNNNVIGIDGEWGSGKSNLVKLVENNINNLKEYKDKYHFYIYDAWGFQNDYQKRSILETLITFLIEKKIISGSKWNSKLMQLLSKKSSIGSKVVKELTPIAKVSALFSCLLPVFIFAYNKLPDFKYKELLWFLPFIVFWAAVLILQYQNMKKYGQTITILSLFKDLFYSYLDYTDNKENVEESIKYETIYEKEASTRDFKNWMKSVNDDLGDNHLIIVFDNMDRLPVEKVQELWAAINVIFTDVSYTNISVLVPFDRQHIKNAFKTENIEFCSSSESTGSEQVSYGDDFINKTFSVVFRVSPPTMSNWEDYFNQLWHNAFNKNVDSSVLQIYDLLSTSQTPRKIIAFINEFVAIEQLLKECNETIPEKYIALFIFGKNKISSNPTTEILKPTYLGALDFLYKSDENLPKYISALYYQLPADDVLDIVYTEQLKKALNEENSDAIIEMQTLSIFFSLLQNAIVKISNVKNAVLVLDKTFENNEDDKKQKQIWDCLYRKVNTTEVVLQNYQLILLKNITNKKEYLKKIITDFYSNDKFSSISFAKSIKSLRSAGFYVDDYLQSRIIEPKDYVTFVQDIKDDYSKFEIRCDSGKLDEYLSSFDDVNELKQITALSYIKLDDNVFPKFSDKLQKLIETHKSNYANTVILFQRLKEIRRPTGKILDDASIINLFGQAKKEDEFYYDLLAMRITRITSYQGFNANVIDGVINQKDETIASKVAAVIEYYINFGNLLGQIDKLSKYPLYNLICKGLIKASEGISTESILNLLAIYEKVVTKLNVTPEDYISRVNGWMECLEDEISIENISRIPLKFFEDSKKIYNETTIYCRKIANDYLHAKTVDDWKDIIVNEKYEYKLALIIESDVENLFDAFKTLLIEYAEDKQPNLKKEVCNSICELATNKRRSLVNSFKGVRDAFCNGTAKMTDAKFLFVGKWLFGFADLSEKKESLRTILPTQLNIFIKEECIQLLMENEKEIMKMISISGEEADDFKRKIKDLAINSLKGNFAFLNFAEKIGIKLEREIKKEES